MSTYLITTSEERSWPDKGRVLFLGEWCKRYDRESEWLKFDSITAEPHAIGCEDRKAANDRAEELFEILLSELVDELNKFHGTSYSRRFWYIMIGRWLYKYVRLIISRFNKLELALNNFNIDKTIVLDSPKKNLSTSTYKEFTECLNDDALWGHMLYSNILENWPKLDITFVKKKVKDKNTGSQKDKKDTRVNWKEKTRALILFLYRALSFFKRNNDAVIIKSYLPMFQEVKLQLALGQFPQLWSTPEVDPVDIDIKLRAQFFQNYKDYQGIERELRRMIHLLIPACYLEGYKALSYQSDNLPWPSKPKFIYTSNSFGADEVFKLWTAKKSELGAPYYIGQHGNSYGTLRRTRTLPDVNTCDKFFSWGWNGVYSNIKVIPAFVFNTINKNHISLNQKGGLLLIGEPIPGEGGWCHDQFYEHILYQKRILCFLTALGEPIISRTTFRLHGSYRKREIFDSNIWKSAHPTIDIDSGVDNFFLAISKSRLPVFSYESTGVLECLSLNIPLVFFWHNGLDDLFPEAIPMYKLLKEAEILHENPESAAEHIIKCWDDIYGWWDSGKVQSARKIFCDKYAKQVGNPVIALRDLLLDD